jgi:predicted ribosome quality control (RQC) complex YloA/Tae2 family protein
MIDREKSRLEKLVAHKNEATQWVAMQKNAELLRSNLHRILPGAREIEVEDFDLNRGKRKKIALNPSLSPGKNVERLFERSRRLKEKLPALERIMEESQTRLAKLEELRQELEEADDEAGITAVYEELQRISPFHSEPTSRVRGPKIKRVPYKEYRTAVGEIIWVGRSARDNEELTFKLARKSDLWFHSQQSSGSHVILRRPNRSHHFSKGSLLAAAQLAAYHSAAKKSETVAVIYTEVRYVRKAKKGGPGTVIAERTKSLMVSPQIR